MTTESSEVRELVLEAVAVSMSGSQKGEASKSRLLQELEADARFGGDYAPRCKQMTPAKVAVSSRF
jgi:hypothetical protein